MLLSVLDAVSAFPQLFRHGGTFLHSTLPVLLLLLVIFIVLVQVVKLIDDRQEDIFEIAVGETPVILDVLAVTLCYLLHHLADHDIAEVEAEETIDLSVHFGLREHLQHCGLQGLHFCLV